MVRALIYAGAGTLVLSYWEVDSAATALWMQTFYEAAQSRPAARSGACWRSPGSSRGRSTVTRTTGRRSR